MRYLGLDLGRATIGLAVADDILGIARALETVRRRSETDDLAALKRVALDYDVGRAVLGLPGRLIEFGLPTTSHIGSG